jgi:hypothetical protein
MEYSHFAPRFSSKLSFNVLFELVKNIDFFSGAVAAVNLTGFLHGAVTEDR